MECLKSARSILHGNIYLWLVVKKSSVLRTQRFTYFSDSLSCLGRMNENPQSNYAWEDKLMWFRSSPQYRALDTIDGEPMEFEWNVFLRIHHIAALQLSPRITVEYEHRARRFHRKNHLHVDVQRHLMAI